jgi:iron complex transport system permease protein
VPRALVAALVGAALAVAGAIIQGLTRNPLADPWILGIEAGAAFAVVCSVFLLGASSLTTYALFAFLGGAIAAVVVYALGTLGGMSPMKLVVAGAALATLLSSLKTAVLILNQQTLEEIRFWLAGSVAGRDLSLLLQVLPYVGVGLLLAFAMGRQITALTLGDDVATGLGLRTSWLKVLCVVAVVLLAGSAVAIAGPIGFVGLVIPHVARFFVGVDYRWVLPYSALLGAMLLVSADIAARLVLRPQELPVGIMTALVGAPFFIYLARKRIKG